MKVAIAGGHGQIALRLTKLLSKEDEVLSLIRNPGHAQDVGAAGGKPVVCDLETAEVDEIAEAIEAADAVVFAAGAGPGSGEARKETMDQGGAVKLIEAAKATGIDRYVMVSAIGADPDAEGEGFAAYLRAKGQADAALRESGLAFTIVRPTHLIDDQGTGKVSIGEGLSRSEITRDDVAAVLAAILDTPGTIGKTFDLTAGETPIDEALSAA